MTYEDIEIVHTSSGVNLWCKLCDDWFGTTLEQPTLGDLMREWQAHRSAHALRMTKR